MMKREKEHHKDYQILFKTHLIKINSDKTTNKD